MIGFQVFEWLVCLVEVLTGILINASVSANKIYWKKSLCASGIAAAIAWGLNQYQLFSFITTIVGIMGIAVSSIIIYQIKWKEAVLVSSAYLLLIYIIDCLCISILAVLFQNKDFAKVITNTYSFFRVVVVVVSKSMLCIICWILNKKVLRNIRMYSWKTWMGVTIISLCIYYLSMSTFYQADKRTLIIWGLILFLLFLGSFSLVQYVRNIRRENELKLMEERNRLIAENSRIMIQNYRDNQMFYHDLKNQHLVIKNYLKNGQYEKAAEYMGAIKIKEQETALNSWTGIETLDILFACKKKDAEKDGIMVTIISDPIQLKMTEIELISLFGNLLDNGIEACRKNEAEKRWIRLALRKVNEIFIFKISNPFAEIPCTEKGELISQKKKGIHGLGMKSVESIVKKYEGVMEIEYQQDIFSVIISFFD